MNFIRNSSSGDSTIGHMHFIYHIFVFPSTHDEMQEREGAVNKPTFSPCWKRSNQFQHMTKPPSIYFLKLPSASLDSWWGTFHTTANTRQEMRNCWRLPTSCQRLARQSSSQSVASRVHADKTNQRTLQSDHDDAVALQASRMSTGGSNGGAMARRRRAEQSNSLAAEAQNQIRRSNNNKS